MSVFAKRNWAPIFSEEAHERCRKHLLSVGYREEDLKPIVWPDDAVHAHRDHLGDPWKFTTQADIRRKRQEDAKDTLRRVRGENEKRSKIQCLYVWVFYCHGISGFYVGWYTYIIGLNFSAALNFRCYSNRLVERLMRLYPLVEAETLFEPPDFEKWMREFAKKYKRHSPHFSRQGKSPVLCEVCGGDIKKIIKKIEWLH